MRIRNRRDVCASLTVLALAWASPALAQKVTVVPDLTGKQVLTQLANPATAASVGDIISSLAAAEIATAPFGTSSGGFVFKLDPSTGLQTRTTTTFGPSFTERALTSGEGKVTIGATFSSTSYDKLSDFSLSALPLGSVTGTTTAGSSTSTGNLELTSKTVAISAVMGVTPNFDVGVVVPLVTVKIEGTSSLVNGNGVVSRLALTNSVFSGLGDTAAIAKYRLVKFKGPDVPDPGGVAIYVVMRLPTGSRENLRGLGVTRTLGSVVASFGRGVLRPHGSAGFEYWSKGVDVASGVGSSSVTLRHQFQYAGGVEIAAAPKLTLLVDLVGQKIMGGGPAELGAVTPVTGVPGIASTQSLTFLDQGINKAFLVPGLKVNLKAKIVLSLNALITMTNNGLHSKVTPVAGINLTM
jgi:hypothetical protein